MASGPYSYNVAGIEVDNYSSVFAIRVTPPFEGSKELYGQCKRGQMEVQEFATTSLAKIIMLDEDALDLDIEIDTEALLAHPRYKSHEVREQQARAFAQDLIDRLNAIDDLSSDEWAEKIL